MADKLPFQITPGTPNDNSVVHASDADVSDLSRSHDERDISRLQGTAPTYDSSKTYNVNDLVFFDSGVPMGEQVFINKTAIVTPEAFNISKWRMFIIDILGNDLDANANSITNLLTTTYKKTSGVTTVGVDQSDDTFLILNTDGARVEADNGGNNIFRLTGYGGQYQHRQERANGTLASPTAILNGDTLGATQFSGYNDTAFHVSSQVKCTATQNWAQATDDEGSQLELCTTENGVNPVLARLIVQNGGDSSFESNNIINVNNIELDGSLNLTDSTELTISAGEITKTKSYHEIDTESDAATDDLDTINGGSEGDVLVLRSTNSARTVVIMDGTGNLETNGDFSLANVNDTITLIFDGTNWLEQSRSDNTTMAEEIACITVEFPFSAGPLNTAVSANTLTAVSSTSWVETFAQEFSLDTGPVTGEFTYDGDSESKFVITYNAGLMAETAGEDLFAGIFKNGTEISASRFTIEDVSATTPRAIGHSFVEILENGDVLRFGVGNVNTAEDVVVANMATITVHKLT